MHTFTYLLLLISYFHFSLQQQPQLFIDSQSTEISVGQSILFDLSYSEAEGNKTLLDYYYYIKYDENGKYTYLKPHNENDLIVPYNYQQEGIKNVQVWMSDQQLSDQTKVSNWTLQNGEMAKQTSLRFEVFNTQKCLFYKVTQTKNDTNLLLTISIQSFYHDSYLDSEDRMTLAIWQLGDFPTILISNQTHLFTIESFWNDNLKKWQAVIDLEILVSRLPVLATIQSQGVLMMGCLIQDYILDVSQDLYLFLEGNQTVEFPSNSSDINIYENRCSPKHALIQINSQYYLTRDSFENFQSVILPENTTQVVMTSSQYLLTLSNSSLYQISSGFTKQLNLPSDITSEDKLYAFSDCLLNDNELIVLAYKIDTTWSISFAYNTNSALYWQSVSFNETFIDLFWDQGEQLLFYLTGSANQTNVKLYSSDFQLQQKLKFEFPVNFQAKGVFRQGMDVYIYGSQLWQSLNGKAFQLLHSFANNELFTQYSAGNDVYALKTNQGSVYIGKQGGMHVIPILFNLSDQISIIQKQNDLYLISFTNDGIKQIMLPVQSLLTAYQSSPLTDLIPVPLSDKRIRFYFSAENLFQQYDENHVIQNQNGKCIIQHVYSNYLDTFCFSYLSSAINDDFYLQFQQQNQVIISKASGWLDGHLGQTLLFALNSRIESAYIQQKLNDSFVQAKLYSNGQSNQDTWLTSAFLLDYRKQQWQLVLDDCQLQSSQSNLNSSILYLTTQQQLLTEMSSYWPEDLTFSEERFQSQRLSLFTSLSNLNIPVQLQSAQLQPPQQFMNFSLQVGSQQQAVTDLTIRPSFYSLKCQIGLQSIRIYQSCPPYISYGQQMPIDYQTLTGSDLSQLNWPEGFSMFQQLKVNYRPPSKYGKAVPITQNIYNADPSQPLYNNYFKVSKTSGSYKSCLNKKTRADCNCLLSQQFSGDISDTDCQQWVLTVFFDRPFTPSLVIYDRNLPSDIVTARLNVTEINGRMDWCNAGQCDESLLSSNVILDLNQNETIQWKGDELYHFKVEVLDQLLCPIEAYIKVYVIRPPLRGSFESLTMAITAYIFCILFLAVYLLHFTFET